MLRGFGPGTSHGIAPGIAPGLSPGRRSGWSQWCWTNSQRNGNAQFTSAYAEMKKRMANPNSSYQGWPILEICKHYLWCLSMATRTAPPVVHKPSLLKHHEDAKDAIGPLVYLEEAEPNNPARWYLSGAAWAAMPSQPNRLCFV